MDQTIINRIKKLMELATRNDNEAEAAVAAEKMNNLLTEHNLSLAEVQAKATVSGSAGDVGVREKKAHTKAAMYQYQRSLMESLATNNFCMYWVEKRWRADPKGNKARWLYDKAPGLIVNDSITSEGMQQGRLVDSHMLLGREENVMAVQVMYDYLTNTMDRLMPYTGMRKRGKEALLWLTGCTERLTGRLTDIRWEKERATKKAQEAQAARGEMGLIRLQDVYTMEDDLNQDYKKGWPPGTTTANRKAQQDRYKAECEREESLVAQGMSKEDAWYVARGMEPAKPQPKIEESEAEKVKRERKQERADQQREQRWARQDHKDEQKRNHPAFQKGDERGGDIGLDTQIRDRKVGLL